jgi:hypothetical protein
MPVYRCDWCGRFYSSQLPEGSACDDHILEHNERHRRQLERFNSRLSPVVREAQSLPSVDTVNDGENKEQPDPHSPSPTVRS